MVGKPNTLDAAVEKHGIVIFVRESGTTESLEEAKASVAGIQALDSPLVAPVITPRCSNKAIEQ